MRKKEKVCPGVPWTQANLDIPQAQPVIVSPCATGSAQPHLLKKGRGPPKVSDGTPWNTK